VLPSVRSCLALGRPSGLVSMHAYRHSRMLSTLAARGETAHGEGSRLAQPMFCTHAPCADARVLLIRRDDAQQPAGGARRGGRSHAAVAMVVVPGWGSDVWTSSAGKPSTEAATMIEKQRQQTRRRRRGVVDAATGMQIATAVAGAARVKRGDLGDAQLRSERCQSQRHGDDGDHSLGAADCQTSNAAGARVVKLLCGFTLRRARAAPAEHAARGR
jgi:hypothetical protein